MGKEDQSKEVVNNLLKVKNKKLYIISLNPLTTLTVSETSRHLPSSVSLISKSYPPGDTAATRAMGLQTLAWKGGTMSGKINGTHTAT